MQLSADIIKFFEKQGFFIVATLDQNGSIHTAAKGIVGIEESGKIYLLDLYKGNTFKNLSRSPQISITAIDEHVFEGYCLKGTAKIQDISVLQEHVIKKWEDKIVKRITNRILRNVSGGKRVSGHQPEANLPHPKYIIEVDVAEVINLSPQGLKS